MVEPGPERRLFALVREVNILHVLFVLYCIPLIVGMVVLGLGVLALAVADPGFAQFVLFTLILGMVLALPAALRP